MDAENPAEEVYSLDQDRYTVSVQKNTSQSVILAISDVISFTHYASSEPIPLHSINANALQKAF